MLGKAKKPCPKTGLPQTRCEHCKVPHRLFQAAKWRAKCSGVEFGITYEDVLSVWPEDNRCPIFGYPFKVNGIRGHRWDSASIDRKNNEKGYVKGNIGIISHRANVIKGDMSVERCEKLLQYMASN
jgi:hypothetical protein